jgi:diguanylate cyclase (GGDEF)-like protein
MTAALTLITPAEPSYLPPFILDVPSGSVAGRSRQADLHLEHPTVSRRHARFRLETVDGEPLLWVEDLGSRNGTFVNGSRVDTAYVAPGDRVHLGDVVLRFDLYDPGEIAGLFEMASRLERAGTDHLTGLATRAKLAERGPSVVASARERGLDLAGLMIDLDHFKRLNDTFGHAAGDAVLRAVGQAVRAIAGPDDLAARYGGEEIALLVVGRDPDGAREVAELLRARIACVRFEGPLEGMRVSASMGLATLEPSEGLDALLARADAALYQAKALGRDRLIVAPSPRPR